MLWLLPLLPAGVGLALLARGEAADDAAGPAAIGVAALALAGSGWAWAARPEASADWLPFADSALPIALSAAGEGAPLAVVVAAVSLAVFAYARAFMGIAEYRARFFGFMALFLGAMLWLVLARDLLALVIGFELVGLCSYALIGYWYRDPARPIAANRALITTRCGDLGLYLAAMAAFAGAGTLALDALPGLAEPWASIAAAGLIAAAFGKSAQLPFSGWLSGAMMGPTPVSALLHSATMVAAGVILLVKALPLLEAVGWALPLILWAGVATALAGGAIALLQSDLKQLLAGSTVSQYGYMVAGIGAAAGTAALTHLAQHAAIKALLFLCAGVLVRQGLHELREMGGLRHRLPGLSLAFGVGALSLAALPPAGGFFTKDALMLRVEHANLAAWLALLAATALTAAYAARAWLGAFGRRDRPADAESPRRGLMLPVWALALPAAVLGIPLALPPLAAWWAAALGMAELPAFDWLSALWSFLPVLAGLAAAVALHRSGRLLSPGSARLRRRAEGWFGLVAYLDAIGRAAIAAGRALDRLDRTAPALHAGIAVRALARAVHTFDAAAIAHGLVDGSVRVAYAAAAGARLTDREVWSGAIDRTAAGLQSAALGLGRIQTGMLHQYYAFAWAGAGLLMAAAFVLMLRI